MAFIEKKDFDAVINLEDLDVITDGNDELITGELGCINVAISEAQGYLDRFNTDELFARSGTDRDPLLAQTIVSIATLWLCRKCAANQSIDDIKDMAKYGRQWLASVQAGTRTPKGWPLKSEPQASTFFHVGGRPKRITHF